ncbi:hypothetical protein [Saccharothrix syringae]|uniref:sunset domain-containing protein n=1 Tax=Saccharothrix syringae TaxID=103733 RepID=UPI00052749D2|nr:hypothetical protein [Saccharothrix syringae]
MSSLFGQVWLWSLLSFAAGVALTWLVMVRPAKRRLEEAEDRALAAPRSVTTATAVRERSSDWDAEPPRSLVDDVLTTEPPRYDVSDLKLDKREDLLEELDDEHRPLSDFEEEHDFPELEDDRPRSLFDRQAPETPAQPVPVHRGVEEEPEPPAEETRLLPPVPVAEVAPRREQPTAPPEVEAFRPREVWREETAVQDVYHEDEVPGRSGDEEDEPERGGVEETTLIPATELAEAIAEVDREEAQVWPEHDLTGHFAPVRVDERRGADGPRTEVMKPVPAEGARGAEAEPYSAPEPVEAAAPTQPRHASDDRPTDIRPLDVRPADVQAADVRSGDALAGEARSGEALSGEVRPAEVRPADPEPFEPVFVEPTPADPEPFVPTFVEPEAQEPAHPTSAAQPAPAEKKEEPARPRSLFEPLLTPEDELEPDPRPTPKPARPAGNDQPFVPKLAPELLASTSTTTTAGLPQRPVRQPGDRRTPPSQQPTPTPPPAEPLATPPPRPVRPRPVGFSPSTGGRPAGASTRYRSQEEGFNPRSPFGPGSVLPKSDGMAPAPEFQVKATLTGRRYFTNESANFRETRADVWFRTTADAEKAGFRQAP